ncbi:MAG: 3-isopropylmalate dehydrogenase [Planctomycetaceae bacterium]|jgi:tartrate dehydrogenase/decarboxylase / D-malate dehydrogenase|nr:3-isopropylmalate dehydrogenase [Planctomycetaceae bacterium]MBT6154795.1 3-isopropylmalate dehydrogenase [Planctomycetaceae bacterium]MBT6486662.1 3-isopropylmalate dehydrogenase [Planctomycetaceae bacterium]MBT6493353.1 3-isopropylmalate dehydrogenase [Planctomycetaceae bacterium]
MSRTFSIAVIEGDGIGPEVTREAIRATEAAAAISDSRFEWNHFDWGTDYYLKHGKMAADDFLDQLVDYDAILLGAVGHPDVQDHITLNGLLLPIRRRFDQCVCLRPAYLYAGVESPLRDKQPGSIDILVFRENVEGEYANIGGRLYQHQSDEVAVQTSVFTRRGCERIIRAAFEKAMTRPKKHVTSITKSNAQGYGMVLWDEVFTAVATDFPDIATDSLLIDAAVMEFVRRPESFDVVVASNLFGDILTDLGAIIIGSMGLAPSANIDPARKHLSMFEPVHGSAPDITGQGIANPLAAILSAAMMLEHLELPESAAAIHRAVGNQLANDGPRTPDLGGNATTEEVGAAVTALIAGNQQ